MHTLNFKAMYEYKKLITVVALISIHFVLLAPPEGWFLKRSCCCLMLLKK